MSAAASSMRFEVFDLVRGLPGTPGLSGSGGGALSGSELSHLQIALGHRRGQHLQKSDIHGHRAPARLRERVLMLDHSRLSTVHRTVPRSIS